MPDSSLTSKFVQSIEVVYYKTLLINLFKITQLNNRLLYLLKSLETNRIISNLCDKELQNNLLVFLS